ncbi:MAG: riboflavin synthase [Acidobacteriota bacterium]
MFTGLISGTGKFISLEKSGDPVLTLRTDFARDVVNGDSVSVNGSCLTIVDIRGDKFSFNVGRETLGRTNLSDQMKGDILNIELPLTLNDLVSGHLVSGHIDGVARVRSVKKMKGSIRFVFGYTDREWKRYIIEKGSIAVNGVSLTVNEIQSSTFSVDILPFTFNETNLRTMSIGKRVNIELDLVGKYLYNQRP